MRSQVMPPVPCELPLDEPVPDEPLDPPLDELAPEEPLDPPPDEVAPSLPLEPPLDELVVVSSPGSPSESLEQPNEPAAATRERAAGTATHQGKKRSGAVMSAGYLPIPRAQHVRSSWILRANIGDVGIGGAVAYGG